MKKTLYYISAILILHIHLIGQCTFTTNIIPLSAPFCAGSSLTLKSTAADKWVQKNNLSGTWRTDAVSFGIGIKGYMGTGVNSLGYLNDFWEYDPSTDTWTQLANFGGPARVNAVGMCIGTKGYIGTGNDATVGYNDFWEYDPATNTWTQKSSIGLFGRNGAIAFSIGTKGYLGLGSTSLNPNDFYEYDPATDTWTTKLAFPGNARYDAVAFSVNNLGFVCTGYNSSTGLMNDVWQYDPTVNSWTQKSNFSGGGRMGAIGFSIGNKGYLGCGSATISDFWKYDPLLDSWTQKTSYPGSASSGNIAFSTPTRGYVGLGYLSTNLDIWEYEPDPSYFWSTGQTSQTISVNVSGTYSVLVTDNLGCTATAVNNIMTIPLPTITISGADTVCAGSAVVLTANGGNAYYWHNTSTTSNTILIYPNSTTEYAITGTSSQSCSSFGIFQVFVKPLPAISIAATNTICEGDSITMTAGGALSYTWSSNAGGSMDSVLTVTPSTSTVYSVTGTSSQSCVSTATLAAVVYTNPVISVGDGTLCAGKIFTITPSGASTYIYSGGSATVSPSIGITSYSVIGVSPAGCLSSNTATLALTAYSVPILSVSGGTACTNSVFTLTPSGADSYTFSGAVSNNNATVSAGFAGQRTVTVMGSNSFGCKSVPATATVTFYTTPDVFLLGGDLCYGNSFTLGASTNADIYTFYSGTTALLSPVVSPSITTSYTVIGTDTTSGCSNWGYGYVTVVPTLVISAPSGSICLGGHYIINPTGAFYYTFSSGSSTLTGFSVTVSPTITTTYVVTGNSVGCVSPVGASVTVTVVPNPVITVNSGSICAGEIFTINPTGASNYTFFSSGTPTVHPLVNTSYFVSGTSTAGCISTASCYVTVFSKPVIGVNSGSICVGAVFTMAPSGASTYTYSSGSATVSPAVGLATFSVAGTSSAGCVSSSSAISHVMVVASPIVTANNGSVCAGEIFSITPSGAANYTYSCGSSTVIPTANVTYSITGSSAGGCVSSNTAIASVTVSPLPVVSVNSGSICSENSFTMNPSGAASYTFSSGTATVHPSSSTSYSVTGTAANGCKSGSAAISNVTVVPKPLIIITGTLPLLCSGEALTLTANGAGSYAWDDGTNEADIVITPSVSTSYTVQGTMSGCTNSAAVTQNVAACTFISSNTKNTLSFSAYPNPNNGEFIVEIPSSALMYVYNNLSQLILDQELQPGKNQIRLSTQPNGIYQVVLRADNANAVFKIIRQ